MKSHKLTGTIVMRWGALVVTLEHLSKTTQPNIELASWGQELKMSMRPQGLGLHLASMMSEGYLVLYRNVQEIGFDSMWGGQ